MYDEIQKPSPTGHELAEKAAEAAATLRLLGNDKRLMVLCALAERGEMPVMALVDAVGISQSALSQHLARMRSDGIVTFRRDSQTLYYRIADPRIARILDMLRDIYCPS